MADVAQRLGVSTHSLYEWLRKAKSAANADGAEAALLPTAKDSAEVRRLKAEIKRLTEERDILKNVRCQGLSICIGRTQTHI